MNQEDEVSGSVPRALNFSDVMENASPTGDFQIITNLPNNGGTFAPQSTVNFAINVPVNSFADMSRAYFKFTIENTGATNKLMLDKSAGGAGIIDSIRILSPTGQVISEQQHYNALTAFLADYTSPGHVDGYLNVAEGCTSAPLGKVPAGLAAGAAAITGRVEIAKSTSESFTHVPHGGLFNSDRYMPLGFINGQLQIQLQIASEQAGVLADKDKTSTWTSKGWELHIPIVRTAEDFNVNLRQLMSSGVNLNIHMKDWSNQQATVSSGSVGETNILLANRKRSVDAVFAMFRSSGSLSNQLEETSCARRTCGLLSYQYTVAGVDMPSKAVTGSATDIGEYMVNTQMALGKLGYSTASSIATRANYYQATDTTTGSVVVYALDLSAYKGVLAGKNLSSAMPLILKAQLGGDATSNATKIGSVVCDVFSQFDSILTLSGPTGSLTVSN